MSTYVIDPRNNWTLLESRHAQEADPLIRNHLQTVIDHAKAECIGDFDMLMATVSPRAEYNSRSGNPEADIANSPKGRDAVAEYYTGIVQGGLHRIEHNTQRITADTHNIVEEGPMKMAFPGAYLKEMQLPADPDTLYLYETYMTLVWTFDEDGLVAAEDSYAVGDGFAGIIERPLSAEQIYTVTSADL